MRIRADNGNPVDTASGQIGRTAETEAVAPSIKGAAIASASPAAADGLQLSKSADTVSRIAKSESANRSQRVLQLAAAGRSGSYRVESEAVSKAIVDQAISTGQGAP